MRIEDPSGYIHYNFKDLLREFNYPARADEFGTYKAGDPIHGIALSAIPKRLYSDILKLNFGKCYEKGCFYAVKDTLKKAENIASFEAIRMTQPVPKPETIGSSNKLAK